LDSTCHSHRALSAPLMAMGEMCGKPEPLRVMTYNILADELSSNLVPRTMEEPSREVKEEICGPEGVAKFQEIVKALNDEYRKWHPMKTWITDPQGVRMKSRGLWDQLDLTTLAEKGWELSGVKVEDAVTLDGGKTFLGVVQNFLDQEHTMKLYETLHKVQVESRAWEARGPRILAKVAEMRPTLLGFQEFDVQDLPTGRFGSFRAAVEHLGYEGANFIGPGQEKVGLGIFWLKSRASLEAELPE
ncbi:unnamed protein product, partial [Effrenium voratum]